MVKVKICGITNLEDAKVSAGAGCDALGFVFYKKSPRYIEPSKAKKIIALLPKSVVKVGVFVDEKEEKIKRIARLCGLDMLQFHGNESEEFCARFRGYRVIKAFRLKDKAVVLERLSRYKIFAYLFDAYSKSKAGGTGRVFDWRLVRHIDNIRRPVFLSGGLTEKNVNEALKRVKPDWVDVCSSVEASPGRKDHNKVVNFINVAKGKVC